MTKQIPLTQGQFAVVDDDVYVWAGRHKWYARRKGNTFYAVRAVASGKLSQKIVRLHREIMNAPDGMHVDHINGNGLDCTRANMRVCTQSENKRNRKINSNNQSGYKGVWWHNSSRKWQSGIRVGGKRVHLGYFANIEDAARAYDIAALKYHGEFAKTNF